MFKLRRTYIAGALLLALVSTIWLRLDAVILADYTKDAVFRVTNSKLISEKTSLTFLHGIGLRLDDISLDHSDFFMQAGHMDINIKLLPLLFGNIEVSTLDIHDAHFKVHKSAIEQASASLLATAPVDRIKLVRYQIETFAGEKLLENGHLDLRNIGPDRKTLWELQAQQGKQSLSGHGNLNFIDGEISKGFGKLKLKQVAVSRLQLVAPVLLRQTFKQSSYSFDGALTIDITGKNTWSVFGQLGLGTAGGDEILSLRGKLSHPVEGQFFWRDSFVHFADGNVITTQGQCRENECRTSIEAKSIPIATWSPLLPSDLEFLQMVKANTAVNGSLQWRNGEWRVTGKLELNRASFQYRKASIKLPDLRIRRAEMSGNKNKWQANATLVSPTLTGAVNIRSKRGNDGAINTVFTSSTLDNSWQPVANLLLASLHIDPALKLSGMLNGTINLQQKSSENSVQLEVDATGAHIAYPLWFAKPEGISATCKASIKWPHRYSVKPTSVSLSKCLLDTSRLDRLKWRLQEHKQTLEINNLIIDFNSLHKNSVELPESLHAFRGGIRGNVSSKWSGSKGQTWKSSFSGEFDLDKFGTSSWNMTGPLKATKGLVSSKSLQLGFSHGEAVLQGEYSFARKRGNIDLTAASVDWNSLPTLSEAWSDIHLTGQISDGQLTLLQNNWQNINSHYLFKRSSLELTGLKSSIAGGHFNSPSLKLSPVEKGLKIQGNILASDIKLQDISALNLLLQTELSGELHTNIHLQGQLPKLNLADWKNSNGDILVYDGGRKKQHDAVTLTEKLGLTTPPIQSSEFRKLSFRFRISSPQVKISQIEFLHQKQHFKGEAVIAADYKIQGNVNATSDQSIYTLDGTWPNVNWKKRP